MNAPSKNDNQGILIVVGALLLLLAMGGKKAATVAKFKVGDCVALVANLSETGTVLTVIAQTAGGFAYSVKFAATTSAIPEAQLVACAAPGPAIPAASLTGDITLSQVSNLLTGRRA